VRVDTNLTGAPGTLAAQAVVARRLGFDGVFTSEVAGDPFVAAAVVTQHAGPLTVGTKVAVAFARSPMTTAYAAHDLGELTGGRFVLGLGTQVKAHITRRFDMPWSDPARRMRDYVLALRSIWSSWRSGAPLDHQGDFYRFSLMSPTFVPPASTPHPPQVWVAAVGPVMAEAAAEVADGVVLHAFSTRDYVDTVFLPAVGRGLARAGRTRADIQVSAGGFVVTGTTAEDLAASRETTRARVAFYGSTPSYRPVWEANGLGDLGDRLRVLAASGSPGRWAEMAALISNEVLDLFVVAAPPGDLAEPLHARHGYADRIALPPLVSDEATWARSSASAPSSDQRGLTSGQGGLRMLIDAGALFSMLISSRRRSGAAGRRDQ